MVFLLIFYFNKACYLSFIPTLQQFKQTQHGEVVLVLLLLSLPFTFIKGFQLSFIRTLLLSKKKLNMRRIFLFTFFFFVSLLVISLPRKPMISKPHESKPTIVLPLYTNSRWIVDEGGKRVKLACVNWVSHLEPMVAEGLSKQPMDAISKKIVSMGFNCVRLTWPLFLVTNDSLASLTVRQSFQSLGLFESIAGIQANNPSIIDLPLIKAYQVKYLHLLKKKIMTSSTCEGKEKRTL